MSVKITCDKCKRERFTVPMFETEWHEAPKDENTGKRTGSAYYTARLSTTRGVVWLDPKRADAVDGRPVAEGHYHSRSLSDVADSDGARILCPECLPTTPEEKEGS